MPMLSRRDRKRKENPESTEKSQTLDELETTKPEDAISNIVTGVSQTGTDKDDVHTTAADNVDERNGEKDDGEKDDVNNAEEEEAEDKIIGGEDVKQEENGCIEEEIQDANEVVINSDKDVNNEDDEEERISDCQEEEEEQEDNIGVEENQDADETMESEADSRREEDHLEGNQEQMPCQLESPEDIFNHTPREDEEDAVEVTPRLPRKRKVKRRQQHKKECPKNPSRKLFSSSKKGRNDVKKSKKRSGLNKRRTQKNKEEFLNRDVDELCVWVQCENKPCRKWRFLCSETDPANVNLKWTCDMHPDKTFNSCDKPEEDYTQLEFVHSKFTEGSIVWAKMQGYPWWPAMIEADPDSGNFMKHDGIETEATRYHCVFLDNTVSRSWVPAFSVKKFEENGKPPGSLFIKRKDYSKQVIPAKERATQALNLSITERIKAYGFSKTFKGVWMTASSDDDDDTPLQEMVDDSEMVDIFDSMLSSHDIDEMMNDTDGIMAHALEAVNEEISGDDVEEVKKRKEGQQCLTTGRKRKSPKDDHAAKKSKRHKKHKKHKKSGEKSKKKERVAEKQRKKNKLIKKMTSSKEKSVENNVEEIYEKAKNVVEEKKSQKIVKKNKSEKCEQMSKMKVDCSSDAKEADECKSVRKDGEDDHKKDAKEVMENVEEDKQCSETHDDDQSLPDQEVGQHSEEDISNEDVDSEGCNKGCADAGTSLHEAENKVEEVADKKKPNGRVNDGKSDYKNDDNNQQISCSLKNDEAKEVIDDVINKPENVAEKKSLKEDKKDEVDKKEMSKKGKGLNEVEKEEKRLEREENKRKVTEEKERKIQEKERKMQEKEAKKLKKEQETLEKAAKKKAKELQKQQMMEEKQRKKKEQEERKEKKEKGSSNTGKKKNKTDAEKRPVEESEGQQDKDEKEGVQKLPAKKPKFSAPKGKQKTFVAHAQVAAQKKNEADTIKCSSGEKKDESTTGGSNEDAGKVVENGNGQEYAGSTSCKDNPTECKKVDDKRETVITTSKAKKKKFCVKRKEMLAGNEDMMKNVEGKGEIVAPAEEKLKDNLSKKTNSKNEQITISKLDDMKMKHDDKSDTASVEDKEDRTSADDLNQKRDEREDMDKDDDFLDLDWNEAPVETAPAKKHSLSSAMNEDSDPFEAVEE